jgi:hypothetical protein
MKTATQYYKAIAVLTLNVLVIFGCLNIAAMALLKMRSAVSRPDPVGRDAREKSSYYIAKSWASQYWNEMVQSRKQRYHAYTVWRRAPFRGETINIDEDGVRLTPGSDCRPNAFKVFTFGGSPMWGTGSPDWATIPAYLEPGFENWKQEPVCIRNFGESGYVSTQSVIELMLQVQSGNIPDIAIFFDGPNDVYTSYQSGKSGVHENLEQIAARMERRDQPQSPLLIQLLESFSLFRLIDNQVTYLNGDARPAPALITYETMHVDLKTLTESVTTKYLTNYEAVSALAEKHGFDYYFFWPPHMSSTKKPLTSEEQELKHAVEPGLEKLYESVYQAMQPGVISRYKHLYSITELFDKTQSLIWLDDAHVTPVGNQMIAQRILQIITGGVSEGSLTKGSHDHKDVASVH